MGGVLIAGGIIAAIAGYIGWAGFSRDGLNSPGASLAWAVVGIAGACVAVYNVLGALP